MGTYGIKTVSFGLKYPPMDIEKRRSLLPEKSISSLYPAKADEDVLVTGNGIERIDIVGDPYHERIIYRRERIMDMRWKDTPEPPDVAWAIPEARAFLREGKFEQAAKLMDKATKDAGYDKWIDSRPFGVEFPRLHPRLHSVIELLSEIEEGKTPHDYLRYLNLFSGEAIVRCEDEKGGILRKSFASFPRNMIVQRTERMDGSAFDAKLRFVAPGGYELPDHFDQFVLVTYNDMYEIPGSSVEITAHPDSCTVSLAYDPKYGKRGYCCCSAIDTDGEVIVGENGRLSIKGAHQLTIYSRTNKYEDEFSHAFAAGVLEDVKREKGTYEEMLAENQAFLEPLMKRSQISLGGDWASAAEELLNEQHSQGEVSPKMMEKLYDMGRFFMIADTGEDPPSLFQHNINTNLQVCAGNMTGLPEVMDAYFRFYERKWDDFKLNAKRFFGARGVLGNIHCDYNSGKFYQFSIVYPHYCWTACLGWIWNELWGHYLVSNDEDFLRDRVVPGLKDIALFYEDYLSDEDENGKVLFYPSYSPEDPSMNDYHVPFPKDVYAMNVNSLMDIMVCREVLDNLLHACEILGIDDPDIPKWKTLRSKLPDYLMDEDGAVKEWSFKPAAENYDHRHVSHHYDVWPGRAISPEKTPELVRPFILSNRKRGHQDDSAHGVIHRYFTAVRLDDHKDAMHNLRTLLEHGYVTRTLNTVHYPYRVFCPDLLGALPAMILEMLVYSDEGFIKLLPSVPEDMAKGKVSGVWLYTFAKIEEMQWDLTAGKASAVISSLKDQDVTFRFPLGFKSLAVDGEIFAEDGENFTLALKKDGTVKLDFELPYQDVNRLRP